MFDTFDEIDGYKVLFSLVAGLLLGMERELKDKAAGVKTISIICLGATLFAILSQKHDPTRATALAAYIVSGVGFLGAGVIFRDGVNISGLTTASIIWLSAAIGTSIGFGSFYLAGAFLLGGFLIIWFTPSLNRLLVTKKQEKLVTLRFTRDGYADEHEVVQILRKKCFKVSYEKISMKENTIEVVLEVVIQKSQLKWLGEFLITHPKVISFTL